MTRRNVPIFPAASRGESISGWLERTASFYGCDLEHWIAPILLRDQHSHIGCPIDLDVDRGLRQLFSHWSGISLSRIPSVIAQGTDMLLPPRARLSFCPRCWDEDLLLGGQQPFVRKLWAYATTVHCEKHFVFMSTKAAHPDPRRDWVSWRTTWESQHTWDKAFDPGSTNGENGVASVSPNGWASDKWQLESARLLRFRNPLRGRELAALRMASSATYTSAVMREMENIGATESPALMETGAAPYTFLPLRLEIRIPILLTAACLLERGPHHLKHPTVSEIESFPTPPRAAILS